MASTLVLLDVDKTVIDKKYQLTVELHDFVRAIERAQDAGITVGLNSDSALPTIRSWAKQWHIEGPLLAEQSVICLQHEDNRIIPMHGRLTQFQAVRDAFVTTLVRDECSLGQLLVVAGDVNQMLSERTGGEESQQPSDCAADSRRDDQTSQHLADEHRHRSLRPFTRNSMRRLCCKPARVCATDSGREAP